jgi:hypothetical protein
VSLYRDAGRTRRRRRIATALAAAALLALALVVAALVRGGGPPSDAERAAAARAAAATALDGLELLTIEYGQAVRDGRVLAPTEYAAARADVRRAQDAIRIHADDLAVLDPHAPRAIATALDRVETAVARRVEESRLHSAIAEARTRLTALARAAVAPGASAT